MTTELQVDLLGGLRVRRPGGAEIRIQSRKAQAVLACLALQPGTTYTRDFLSSLLWEDSDPELARASLRQALAALRRSLPEGVARALQGDTQAVMLDETLVTSDVARFRALLRDGSPDALGEIADGNAGTLLEGFDARSSAFEQWVEERRRELRREQLQTLERAATQLRAVGDTARALSSLERLTTLEPTNERAQRELIEALTRHGRYTDALRQFRACRDALRRELDVAPEPATEALHREVLRRRRAVPTEGPATDDPETSGEVVARPGPTDAGAVRLPHETLSTAVVLAISWPRGSDEDDPEFLRDQQLARDDRLRAVIERHGGLVEPMRDGISIAAFGLRGVTGHELTHATRAALELIASSAPGDTACAIGMAQGLVLPPSQESALPVTGRPVNLARDLARGAGPGALATTSDAGSQLETCFELQSSVAPDGGRIATVRVLRERDVATSLQFVGRRAELAMVVTLLERVVAGGRGRTIVVRGDPGIGKSSLLEALGQSAAQSDIDVYMVPVLDFGQATRDRPLPTLASRLLGLPARAADDVRTAAVQRCVAEGQLTLPDVAIAEDLLGVASADVRTGLQSTIDDSTRERGRARVLGRLLAVCARRRPLLIVVEDVHWADTVEVAQLADVAAATANLPVLLALSTRADGDPINAAWRARARGSPVTTLDLAPLADDEARELAATFGALGPAVIARCIETAAGNPLYLGQLLRAAQHGQADIPGSVRSLLLARVERLDEASRHALHAAAVLGSRFSLAELRHLLADLTFDPAALDSAGMLAGEGDERQFAHALIRDAVYESLLRTVRRDWHRRAALWYEGRDHGLHADHLAAAGDPGATAAYLRAAAQQQRAHRLDHALAHASRARETAVHAIDLCDACAMLGDVFLARGRTDDAIASFRESIDLATTGAARARAWLGLAASLRIGDRYDEALAALDHAEQGAAADADPRRLAQLWTLRGNLHFPRGELDECLAAHQRAREFAELSGSIDDLARSLGGLGDAHYQRGRMRTAREQFSQCVALCEQHGLEGLRLAYLPMVAVTAAYMGELGIAMRVATDSTVAAAAIGDLRAELLGTSIRANVELSRADYPESLAASERSIALAKEIGARRFEAEAVVLQGLSLRGLGRHAEAHSTATRAAALSREFAPTYCGPWALAALALITDDVSLSRDLLDEGERLLARGCVSHNHLDFRPIAIDVSLRDGDLDGALHHAAELERYTSDEPLAPASMYVARARLCVDFRRGRADDGTYLQMRNILQVAENMGFKSIVADARGVLDR